MKVIQDILLDTVGVVAPDKLEMVLVQLAEEMVFLFLGLHLLMEHLVQIQEDTLPVVEVVLDKAQVDHPVVLAVVEPVEILFHLLMAIQDQQTLVVEVEVVGSLVLRTVVLEDLALL